MDTDTNEQAKRLKIVDRRYARRRQEVLGLFTERDQVIRSLLDAGWTLQQVGDVLGVTRQRVKALLRQGEKQAAAA